MEPKKCVDLLSGEKKKKNVRWTTAEDLKLWSSSSHTWADMAAAVHNDDIKAVRAKFLQLTTKKRVSTWTRDEGDLLKQLTLKDRKDHSKLKRMTQKLKKGKEVEASLAARVEEEHLEQER
ncbi:unnamed protein product, partial [Brassica rapa subsp. trilocularis]